MENEVLSGLKEIATVIKSQSSVANRLIDEGHLHVYRVGDGASSKMITTVHLVLEAVERGARSQTAARASLHKKKQASGGST